MNSQKYRSIIHVDMDAFFAAIEQIDNIEYMGKPVVVGANPKEGKGRGVVSASSYEAREYGIHSAMPISHAYKLCPDAVFVRPRMSRYSEMSQTIMGILKKFSPVVEPISIDEAFLDCTGTRTLFGPPEKLGLKIKKKIFDLTGLYSSVGIGSNKSIAKIASDLQKPDGLTICPNGIEKEFLAPLSVSKLWGAGEKTVKTLNSMGFYIIGDIASCPLEKIEAILGRVGSHLWFLANGIDEREVTNESIRKSIGEETTFEKDVDSHATISKSILYISDRLSRRMRREKFRGRTVTLKIRLQGFETFTRSITFNNSINDMYTLRDTALQLYNNFDRGRKKVRLIGISMSNLVDKGIEDEQLELFPLNNEKLNSIRKKEKLEQILDNLKNDYGGTISRASLLETEKSDKKK